KYRTINNKKTPGDIGEQLGFQFETLEKWIYKGDHIKQYTTIANVFLILLIVYTVPVHVKEIAKENQIINIIDNYIVVYIGRINRDLVFFIVFGNITQGFR